MKCNELVLVIYVPGPRQQDKSPTAAFLRVVPVPPLRQGVACLPGGQLQAVVSLCRLVRHSALSGEGRTESAGQLISHSVRWSCRRTWLSTHRWRFLEIVI